MKTIRLINSLLLACLGAGVMVAGQAQGATYRYQTSGDYFLSTNTTPGQGWQIPAGGVPGAADVARYNWGNNTVTLAGAAPNITRFEMGVDESGGLVVNNGGSLTLSGDGRIGNNAGASGANPTTGFLTINAGGAVTNLGSQLRLGVGASTVMGNLKGLITLNGGTLQDNGHLWVGAVTNTIGTIYITNGGVLKVGGNFGLGTVDANVPSGGRGFVYVGEGGLLKLKQISSNTNSIWPNSVLDVSGSGLVIITNNYLTQVSWYTNNGRITAYGGLGTVGIDYGTSNALQTTIFAIAPPVPPPTNCVWNPALNNPTATQGFWNVSSNWNVGQTPFSVTKVVFSVTNAIPCWVTNAAVAAAVVIGDGGPGGTLIITNGGSLTVNQSSQPWSAIGYNSNALLVVESGAAINFANQLWVGFTTNATGTLIMNGGTVTVGGPFGLGYHSGGDAGTGTALIHGGQLNLASAPQFQSIAFPGSLGSGLLDVASNGVVVINGNQKLTVDYEISVGLITNSTGTGLVVDYNNVNVGKTTIYAADNSAISLAQTTWNPVNNNPSDPDGLWNVSTNWDGGLVPNSGTKVNFNLDGQLPCTVTNAAVAGRIVMGSGGPGGTLIVTNGATLTVGSTDWSAIAYSSNALMVVEAGGSASFAYQLWIGFNPGADGTLTMNGGTVSVANMFGLGWSGGKGTANIHGGTLNLTQWNPTQSISGASVLDVAGTGTVVITGDQTLSVSNYIVAGKITGSPGVYYSYNGITDKTTISTTLVTPPPSQMVTGVTVSGANASLTYQTTAGHSYVIQQTPSLSPASWVNVPGSAVTNATGASVTFPCPMPAGTNSMFYRTVSY